MVVTPRCDERYTDYLSIIYVYSKPCRLTWPTAGSVVVRGLVLWDPSPFPSFTPASILLAVRSNPSLLIKVQGTIGMAQPDLLSFASGN